MLYKLDLRLKEVKQKPETDFGGVSIFLFGDILQLRPVRARFIFEEPRSENFQLKYLTDSLWSKFEVITLRKNHRQGDDRRYSEILNRIREGILEESRVRPINHNDIPKRCTYCDMHKL